MSERQENENEQKEVDGYDITIRVYVRAKPGKLPTKRDVENKISELLLAQPRLDDGADWDVSATSLPPSSD